MGKHEEIRINCCRKLCKTENMTEDEFDDYTAEHCEDCPIGDLEDYWLQQIKEAVNNILKKHMYMEY